MNYLWAFIVGGAICAVGLYAPLAEFAGAGASVPLLGFGHLLAKGVRTAVAEMSIGRLQTNASLPCVA